MIKKYFKLSEFARHVLTLTTGTTIAQAIPIIIAPILTRLYSPDDYGIFAIYVSIYSIIAIIAGLRYELSIMLPDDDDDSINLVVLSNILANGTAFLSFLVIYFFNDQIIELLEAPRLKNWLYLIPVSILATTCFEAFNNWLIRKKGFIHSSVSKVTQTCSEGITGLSLGFIQNPFGLIIGKITGQIIVIIVIIKQAFKNGLSFSKFSMKKATINGRRYIDFPKYSALPALLDNASQHVPVLLINMFYSTAITGIFNFSRLAIAGPLALIATSVSKVFYQRISEKKNNNEKVMKDLLKLTGRLVLIALPTLIIILLVAPDVFAFIFWETWRISGVYAQILSFLFVIRFIVSPMSIVFPALNGLKLGGFWQILHFLGVGVLYLFDDLSIYNFLILYTTIESSMYIVYYIMIIKIVSKYDRTLIKNV